jgi:hypothetical protein
MRIVRGWRAGTGGNRRTFLRCLPGSIPLLVCLCGFTQACVLLPAPPPSLLFAQGEARCATPDDIAQATVSVDAESIEISGVIRTDVPCQHLIPRLTGRSNAFLLTIVAVPQPGGCPICLGAIEYEAVIANLSGGTYAVRIRHGEQTIEQTVVTVSDRP